MKRLIVYFSSKGYIEEREQAIKQLNVDSFSFPKFLQEDLLVILLGNVESKINENLLRQKFLRKGNLVVLVPNHLKEHITEICDKKESRLQKNHTSSVTLTESIVTELKRVLVTEEIAESPEQITFDEVIEFEFVQESLESILVEPIRPGEITNNSLKTLIKENPNGLSLDEVKIILGAMKKIFAQGEKPSVSIIPDNLLYDEKKKVVKMMDNQVSTQNENIYKSAEALDNMGDADNNNVYSLACITYELLSGTHPYDGKNAKEVKIAEPPLKPKQISKLNKQQWEFLDKGLIPFKADGRVHTTSTFLDNFLRKTFYDFVKDMVEAPFFVGLVVGEVLLIFTIIYLYFLSGEVSSLESRQERAMLEKVKATTVYEEAYHWVERIKKLKKDTTDLEAYLEVFRTTGQKPDSIASASLQKAREEKKVYIEKNSSLEKFVRDLLERFRPKEKSAQEKDYEEFFSAIKKIVSMSCSPRLSSDTEGWVKDKLNQISTWCNNNKCSNFKTELDSYKSSIISNQCPKNVGDQQSEGKGGQP